MLPVRCSCTKVIGNKGEAYKLAINQCLRAGYSESIAIEHALKTLKLIRTCCRTNLLTYINLHDKAIDQIVIEQNEIANRPVTHASYFDQNEWNSDDDQDDD